MKQTAFPFIGDNVLHQQSGLSKREFIATMALVGVNVNLNYVNLEIEPLNKIAQYCFEQADAMIRESEK